MSEETIIEDIERAKANYPAGIQCTSPMGTQFTTSGSYRSDSRGNILNSDWEFIYAAIYDEWATINPDQPEQSTSQQP